MQSRYRGIAEYDLTDLVWDTGDALPESIKGASLMAYREEASGGVYYKLSSGNEHTGLYGFESVYEHLYGVVAQTLGLGKYVLNYDLLPAKIKIGNDVIEDFVARSYDFSLPDGLKLAYDQFYVPLKNNGESRLDFGLRYGWAEQLSVMFLLDFICMNRDRHSANIEMLKGYNTPYMLAPLFDNGYSFIPSSIVTEEQVKAFNVLDETMRVLNCMGYCNLFFNLRFISTPIRVTGLSLELKNYVLNNLTMLPDYVRHKLWEIIEKRYNYAKAQKVLFEG